MERKGTKRLQKKIILSMLFIQLIPFVFGSTLVYYMGVEYLTASVGRDFHGIAHEVADKVDSIVSRLISEVKLLSIVPDVKKLAIDYLPDKEDMIEVVMPKLLKDYKDLMGDNWSSISVVGVTGYTIYSTQIINRGKNTKNSWWSYLKRLKKGEVFISDIFIEKSTSVDIIEFFTPIWDDKNNRSIGYLKVRCNFEKLFSIVDSVKIGKTGHAMLLNSSGTPLICPILPRKKNFISKSLVRVITKKNQEWVQVKNDAHGGKNSIMGISEVKAVNRMNNMNFGGYKWFVVIRQSPEEFFEPIHGILWRIITSGISVIFLLTLFGWFVVKRVIEPVDKLREGAELIGSGNLDFFLDIKTNDEIEELANSFNNMALKLKVSYEELRGTKKYLENLLMNANDVICTVNLAGKITFANRKVEEWGYKKQELIGRYLTTIMVTDNWKELLKQIYRGKGRQEYEIKFKDTWNNMRDTLISISTLYDNFGKRIGFLGIVRDITEQKKINKELEQSRRLATLGEFSAGIAHEIRNPLAKILMSVHSLKASVTNSDLSVNPVFKEVITSISDLNRVVSELLDYTRNMQLNFMPVDINSSINSVLFNLETDINKFNINIIKEYYVNLPRIRADGVKLDQVFTNIITNGLQAMEKGGDLYIKTNIITGDFGIDRRNFSKDKEKKSYVEIIIQDTGVGILKEDIDKIFNPLFTKKERGTGLGLSITHRIIEAHNGIIKVFSSANEGSKFVILLPKVERNL